MIISSLLKKQLTAFLNKLSGYSGTAFCLTDGVLVPIVGTERFHRERLGKLSPTDGRLLMTGSGPNEVKLLLFAEREEGSSATIQHDSILDLAADGIERFVKNEAEIQALSEELLERYQELHVLYDVIEDVSAVFDEREICRIILRKAVHSLNVDFGSVVLMVGENLEIRCKDAATASKLEYSDSACLGFAQDVVASGRHLSIEQTPQRNYATLGVPITISNKAVGALCLAALPERGMFTSGDRISLGALAGYLGVALNSARLLAEARESEGLRREIEFAQQIQQSLLPDRVPTFEKLDVAARCLPSAQVGGDLFGFLEVDKDHWAVMVADVAGHGLGAAFIMASLRSTLRSEARSGNAAAGILKNANNLLYDDTQRNDVYATAFVALYSVHDNSLNYSNAGHPAALLWKAASRKFCELSDGGTALGLFWDEVYEEKKVVFQTGDILVLYTDGIVEAKRDDDEMFEDWRLRSVIEAHADDSSEVVMNAVLDSVGQFQNGARQRDDITILVFKSR